MFALRVLRVPHALSSVEPRKPSQTKRAPYLSLSVIKEIQCILCLTQVLINVGFIKWGQSVLRIYSGKRTLSTFMEQSEDSELIECKISFLSQKSTAGAADMPDFASENSLTLPLSASLHSLCRWGWQRRPALYFRLIYDLRRGGCIRKISHVNLGHAATTGREKAEEHTAVHRHARVSMCIQLKLDFIKSAQF